ncbi:MAG: hypothetical protein H6708_21845 [Kofleriaceae bacterium]|nr:hypothetical protein [Kofleriaceae bacterium]
MPLPDDVAAGDADVTVVRGAAVVDYATLRTPQLAPGDQVEVRDGDRAIRGRLVAESAGQLLVVGDQGDVHVVLDPTHVVRTGGGSARRGLDVTITAEAAGRVELEITYVTRALKWAADYTLEMEAGDRRAQLYGSLGIDNRTGLAFTGARVTLIDTDRPVKLEASAGGAAEGDGGTSNRTTIHVADPTKPRAEQPQVDAIPDTPRTDLPFAVDVAPGSQAVALLGGFHELPAHATMVYDPVGDDRNLSGRTPDFRRDYGLDKKSTAVSKSVDVDLEGGQIPPGLPAGRVRLVERSASGALTPLGESRIFERAGTGTDKLAPTTSVAIGRAPLVEGRRRRREFTLDAENKRLIEEFEITLTSKADHPIEVTVREHPYRGMNWTLAYQNVGARVAKEGPQKVAMRTTVPAQGEARVVYRIIYTW